MGVEAASEITPAHRPGPAIAEPAADVVVQSILNSIPTRQVVNGSTFISLEGLRNQSRCRGGEFEQMKERLASALTRAGRRDRLEFIADAGADDRSSQQSQYVVHGASYLVTRDGFDCWELWLSIASVEQPLTVWQPESPVWMLRHPRPGLPQIMLQ